MLTNNNILLGDICYVINKLKDKVKHNNIEELLIAQNRRNIKVTTKIN
jgi:hypothetical protein